MTCFSIGYFFLFAVYAAAIPYLQLFLKALGFRVSSIGILIGIFEIAGIAGPLLSAKLADSSGRFRLILGASVILFCLSYFPMRFIPVFAVAALSLAVAGFAFKIFVPLMDALSSRAMSDPLNQYGKVRVTGSFGFIITSLLLEFSEIIDGKDADSILIVVISLGGLYFLSTLLLPSPTTEEKDKDHKGAGDRHFNTFFWLFIVAVFLGWFGMMSHYSFFSLFLQEEYGLSRVSGIWAIGTAAEIAFIFFSGKILRRFGILSMMAAAMVSISIRLGIYALSPSLWLIICAQLLHSFTFGVFHTAAVAFIGRSIGAEKRGLGMAVYTAIGLGTASFFASALGGYMVGSLGFSGLYGIYSIPPLLGTLIVLFMKRRFEKREKTYTLA